LGLSALEGKLSPTFGKPSSCGVIFGISVLFSGGFSAGAACSVPPAFALNRRGNCIAPSTITTIATSAPKVM
jgi:hypothetical protein